MKDLVNIEKVFITGVFDELRICFSCSYQNNHNFRRMLLAKESPSMEFRAIGGQVELSIKANNILIGTVLKSPKIEDQYCRGGRTMPRYLARSFIKSTEATTLGASPLLVDIEQQNYSNQPHQADGEDKFFEASDDLNDLTDYPPQRQGSMSEYFNAEGSFLSRKPSMRPPGFSQISGLMPDADIQTRSANLEMMDDLDTFVRAQIIIYSRHSPLYCNLDNRVVITLAALSFFCHRPTILATVEFVNAINFEEEHSDTDAYDMEPSVANINASKNDLTEWSNSVIVEEPLVKGLLAEGKARVVFYLTLKMAKAQISLMNENETSLATLSQNNLLIDIKLDFCSYSIHDEDYDGYDYSLTGQLSEVRIVYLNHFVQEVKDEAWWLILANVSTSELYSLKRVSFSDRMVTRMELPSTPISLQDTKLILVSDCYLGLEQEHSIVDF